MGDREPRIILGQEYDLEQPGTEKPELDTEEMFDKMLRDIVLEKYGDTDPLDRADLWNSRHDVRILFTNAMRHQDRDTVKKILERGIEKWIPKYRTEKKKDASGKISQKSVKNAGEMTADLAYRLKRKESVPLTEIRECFRRTAQTLYRGAPENETIGWIADSRTDILDDFADLLRRGEGPTEALKKIRETVDHFSPLVKKSKEIQSTRRFIRQIGEPMAPKAGSSGGPAKPPVDRTQKTGLMGRIGRLFGGKKSA
ncbi:hypothetical protein JW899_02140 [Candidatus Uhrbacteria bacterium]|nr:hypothetical protein [Candidatus Uhrbacteria bacterium]